MKPNLHRPSHTLIALMVILATTIRFRAICCQDTGPYNVRGRLVQFENIWFSPFSGPDCLSNVYIHNYQVLDYRSLRMNRSMQTNTISRNDIWSNFFPQYLYNTTYNSTLFNGNNFGLQNASLHYGCDSSKLTVALGSGSNYLISHSVNGLGMNSSIARDDVWRNFYHQYCLYNTTYKSTLFNGNNSGHEAEDVSLYHGCDSSTPKVQLGSNYEFCCQVINATHSRIRSNMLSSLLQCNNHIVVPVKQSSGDRLVPNMRTGFNLQWITANSEKCFQSIRLSNWCESNFTSPELFACYCASENFSLVYNNPNRSGGGFKGAVQKSRFKWKLLVGLSCSTVGIMLLLFVILYQKRRLLQTQNAANQQIEKFIRNCRTLAPKRYKYSEIKKMTNSFQVKLGQGGYGSVYKGKLPDGYLVAVKLLGEAMGDGEDFFNEVASISRTSHVNIVTLLGFCIEGKKRALIYEFMPNGSLDKFLCDGAGSCLDWNTLFQIAKGIARGLEYLHQGCNTRIVHFDIKPHNILLDEEFVPKVSDFGLAKLCKRKESIVSVMGARGTAGYMAPEIFLKSLGGASHKSDVYSYGMVVVQMTGAHKNNNASETSASETYFPDWIYKLLETGNSLGVYGATTEEEEDLARKMLVVSLWCIQSGPSERPSISKVVEMLEGSLQSLQVPPRRFLSSPTLPAISPLGIERSIRERVLTVHTTRDEDFSS